MTLRRASGRAWERDLPDAPTPAPPTLAQTRHWWDWTVAPLERALRRLPGRARHPRTLRDRALVERLARAMRLALPGMDLSGVTVYVASGVVTVEGTVVDAGVRERLAEAMREATGVFAVDVSGVTVELQ